MGIDKIPFEFQWKAFEVMESTPRHTYLVCTKRPHNMAAFIFEWLKKKPVLNNCFLGCTVENQEQADKRIPELLKCRPFKLFLSVEPMLEPIDLTRWLPYGKGQTVYQAIVAGCESGHHARPTDEDWVLDLREQCLVAKVPLFIKQLSINGKMCYDLKISTIKMEDLWG